MFVAMPRLTCLGSKMTKPSRAEQPSLIPEGWAICPELAKKLPGVALTDSLEHLTAPLAFGQHAWSCRHHTDGQLS